MISSVRRLSSGSARPAEVWQELRHLVAGRGHVHHHVRLSAVLQHQRTLHIAGHEEAHTVGPVRLPRSRVDERQPGGQGSDQGHAQCGSQQAVAHRGCAAQQVDSPVRCGAADATLHRPHAQGGGGDLAGGAGGDDAIAGHHASGLRSSKLACNTSRRGTSLIPLPSYSRCKSRRWTSPTIRC